MSSGTRVVSSTYGTVQFGEFGAIIQRGDESGEEFRVVLAEFGFVKLDEVGDVPREVPGQRRGFGLADEGSVRSRFEQGDELTEKRQGRRGVEVGRTVQRRKGGLRPACKA